MPTPPKPSKIHELSGAWKKNPARARARANEPQPQGDIGPPPAEFQNPDSPTAIKHLELWNELIAQCAPGVLTSADRWHLEMLVREYRKVRAGTATSAEKTLVNKMLGQLGLTPADRSKVVANKPKPEEEDDDWREFAPPRRTGTR